MPRTALLRIALSLGAALSLFASLPSAALAYGPMPTHSIGPDISWPQCGTAPPVGTYSFMLVGVTGGKPFTSNDCFNEQFNSSQRVGAPQLYINLDYGLSTAGPLKCEAGDTGCQAYDYGWQTTADAYARALNSTGGASADVANWWLDVETENYWADDTAANTYVIQGALDYLQRFQGRTVGVYSTAYQWDLIAGSFAPPRTPNWVAGSSELYDYGQCSNPLWRGGEVWVVQYLNLDLDLDQNLAC